MGQWHSQNILPIEYLQFGHLRVEFVVSGIRDMICLFEMPTFIQPFLFCDILPMKTFVEQWSIKIFMLVYYILGECSKLCQDHCSISITSFCIGGFFQLDSSSHPLVLAIFIRTFWNSETYSKSCLKQHLYTLFYFYKHTGKFGLSSISLRFY